MGLDVERFVNLTYRDQLICVLCDGVLNDPIQCRLEHIFCRSCGLNWIKEHDGCPVDGHEVEAGSLKSSPRVIQDIIANLDVKCDFAASGCETITKLSKLPFHVEKCIFGRSKIVQTDNPGDLNKADTKEEASQVAMDTEDGEVTLVAELNEVKKESKQLALNCVYKDETINKLQSHLKRYKKELENIGNEVKELRRTNRKLEDKKTKWKNLAKKTRRK